MPCIVLKKGAHLDGSVVDSNPSQGSSKKSYMGVVDLFAFPLLATSLFTCMHTRNDQKHEVQILSAVLAIGFSTTNSD